MIVQTKYLIMFRSLLATGRYIFPRVLYQLSTPVVDGIFQVAKHRR
jgi:hypothetical protein